MLKRLIQERLAGKSEEHQYLDLIQDIINEGTFVEGRNGLTKSVIGSSMYFDLSKGTIPILTTKKVAWKTCLKELLWFVSGDTSNVNLKKQNVKIWNANASREFLDSRGLTHLAEDDLGPVYGHQWRHFNATYNDCNTDYSGKGVDQLAYIINALKDPVQRYSRRLVLSAWNPCQIDEMALPPCHVLMQFNVIEDKLSCCLYQRSGDVGLGVPFNIASYSFLTYILADFCGLKPGEFIYNLGNAHVYDDHIDALKEQSKLKPHDFPSLNIKKRERSNIEDYTIEDFELVNYVSHPPVTMKMRA